MGVAFSPGPIHVTSAALSFQGKHSLQSFPVAMWHPCHMKQYSMNSSSYHESLLQAVVLPMMKRHSACLPQSHGVIQD